MDGIFVNEMLPHPYPLELDILNILIYLKIIDNSLSLN
jgi:hypothetical protein